MTNDNQNVYWFTCTCIYSDMFVRLSCVFVIEFIYMNIKSKCIRVQSSTRLYAIDEIRKKLVQPNRMSVPKDRINVAFRAQNN